MRQTEHLLLSSVIMIKYFGIVKQTATDAQLRPAPNSLQSINMMLERINTVVIKRRACANEYISWQPRANFPRKNQRENMSSKIYGKKKSAKRKESGQKED